MIDKRPLRILRIITRLNVGGPSLQAIDLSCDVTRWQTRLISGQLKKGEQDMSTYIAGRPIDHHRLADLVNPLNPVKDTKALWILIKEIRQFKPDVIHSHHAKAGMLGRLAGYFCGVPTVHTFHGHVFQGHFSPLKSTGIIWAEKLLAPLTTALIAISPRQKEDLYLKYAITEEDRIHVIPLGFHLQRFEKITATQKEIRQQLSLPQEARLLGIVGRLTAVKNHDFFLRALAHLPTHYQAVIIGDGELKESLQQQVSQLNLKPRVHWMATTPTIEKLYRALDLLVITSHSEGTPVAMIEAMAAGLPVVAAEVGGIPDLAQKKQNALLYQPNDIPSFIEKVLETIENPEDTQKQLERAQIYVQRTHNFQALTRHLDQLYHKILR